MQTPPIPASVSPDTQTPVEANTFETRTRLVDDVVYQLMTAAAILLVLGSLWVF